MHMKVTLKAGLASVALAIIASATASAADLGSRSGKSMKDDGYVPAYAPATYGAVGPCYFRSDIGYSWSRDPQATWVGNVNPEVRGESLDNGAFAEAGIGCSMGSRGFRVDTTIGIREERKFRGDVDVTVGVVTIDPPIQTTLKTYTNMYNAYYDFGKVGGGIVPYVGAGIGWAYHKMGNVTVTDPLTPNVINGEDKLSFAWSLMAGVGYQLTDRAILDIGYRYIDLGLARGSHGDSASAWNPRLEIDDQRAHEIKVGLRYHFGTDCCAAQPIAYAPMK